VPHHDGDTLVIPVLRETVVVEKRLFLVEEVRITRTAVRERVQQPVTLRAEQIEIERLDADAASRPSEKGPSRPATRAPSGAVSQGVMMSSVLIGMFEKRERRDAGAHAVAGRRISRIACRDDGRRVDVSVDGVAASSEGEREHEGPIARFFRSLFGDDDDERAAPTARSTARRCAAATAPSP
jgi:hypothetical protein